jgi:hypothetical protein
VLLDTHPLIIKAGKQELMCELEKTRAECATTQHALETMCSRQRPPGRASSSRHIYAARLPRFRSTSSGPEEVLPDFERGGPEVTPESAFVLSTGDGSVQQARGLARAGGGLLGVGRGDRRRSSRTRADLTTATYEMQTCDI